MPKLLVAFDFDHTIIDDNSDTVVRDLLNEKPLTSYSSNGWTSYMQDVFTLLAAQGTTENQIREAVVNLQEVDGFSNLLELLESLNAEIIIISDSNEYFIHHWLVAKGIVKKIKEVFTNPAKFVDGELKIEKYHVQDWCQNSTENLCKGYILENYINERKCEGVVFDQVLYIGDGKNDYCPSTKLQKTDVTFPRVGYALEKKLDQLMSVGGNNYCELSQRRHTNAIAGFELTIRFLSAVLLIRHSIGNTGVLATIHPWTTHEDVSNFIRAHSTK